MVTGLRHVAGSPVRMADRTRTGTHSSPTTLALNRRGPTLADDALARGRASESGVVRVS
jgi:hypothetical protein